MMLLETFTRRTNKFITLSIIIIFSSPGLLSAKAANSNDTGYTILQIVVGFILVSVVISLLVYIILLLKKKK